MSSISRIILPAVLWNRVNSSCAMVQASRQCCGDWTCSLQPFLKFIKVFPRALEFGRVGEPIGRWIAAWWYKAPVHAPVATPWGYCQPFNFAQKWKSTETAPGINTYFCPPSFTVPLCFRVMLSQAGKKNQNASSYFIKCCLTEMWGQKSVLQPQPYVCKARGFSISHCNHCVVPVSLPHCPCPSLKCLPLPSLAFDRAD